MNKNSKLLWKGSKYRVIQCIYEDNTKKLILEKLNKDNLDEDKWDQIYVELGPPNPWVIPLLHNEYHIRKLFEIIKEILKIDEN